MLGSNCDDLLERAENTVSFAVAVVCLIGLFALMHPPGLSLTADEAMWMTTVDKILRGKVLIRDATMAKGPYLTLWHTVATLAFGQNVVALHLAASAWLVIAGICVVWLAKQFSGKSAAVGAAFFYVCAMAHHGARKGAYSEVLMVLPIAAGMLALSLGVRRNNSCYIALAGLCGGIAFLTKQVAVFDFMAMYATVIILAVLARTRWQEAVKRCLALTLGVALAALPFVVYLVRHDILAYFLSGPALQPAEYISVVGVLDAIRNFVGSVTAVIAPNAVICMASLAGFGLTYSQVRQCKDVVTHPQTLSPRLVCGVLLCCWYTAAIVGVSFVRRFSVGHFVQFYPPAAILGGYMLAQCFSKENNVRPNLLARNVGYGLIVFQLALLCVPLAVGIGGWRKAPTSWSEISTKRRIGEYIRARTDYDETVFVWGDQNEILYWAQREMASDAAWATTHILGFGHAAYVGTPRIRPSIDWEWFRGQLEKWRPGYIVIAPEIDILDEQYAEQFTLEKLPELAEIISRHYEYETTIEEYQLYRRIAIEGTSGPV